MRHYCTYFDCHYLLRGLALYESLRAHAQPCTLYVLCLDDYTLEFFRKQKLHRIVPISLSDIEADDPELLKVKAQRSKLEYYFTLSPCLPRYLFKIFPDIPLVTYVDADLFFFSSPEVLFERLGDHSIGIIESRFSRFHQHMSSQAGHYNVSWIIFRRDENTNECLNWWRARCMEWCFDRFEDGKFGDQKYLDCWPEKFKGVKVLNHPGADISFWNVYSHQMSLEKRRLHFDGETLIFYHCSGIKYIGLSIYAPGITPVNPEDGRLLARMIYGPYLRRLQEIQERYKIPHTPSIEGLRSSSDIWLGLKTIWLFLRSGHYIFRQLRNGSMFRLR